MELPLQLDDGSSEIIALGEESTVVREVLSELCKLRRHVSPCSPLQPDDLCILKITRNSNGEKVRKVLMPNASIHVSADDAEYAVLGCVSRSIDVGDSLKRYRSVFKSFADELDRISSESSNTNAWPHCLFSSAKVDFARSLELCLDEAVFKCKRILRHAYSQSNCNDERVTIKGALDLVTQRQLHDAVQSLRRNASTIDVLPRTNGVGRHSHSIQPAEVDMEVDSDDSSDTFVQSDTPSSTVISLRSPMAPSTGSKRESLLAPVTLPMAESDRPPSTCDESFPESILEAGTSLEPHDTELYVHEDKPMDVEGDDATNVADHTINREIEGKKIDEDLTQSAFVEPIHNVSPIETVEAAPNPHSADEGQPTDDGDVINSQDSSSSDSSSDESGTESSDSSDDEADIPVPDRVNDGHSAILEHALEKETVVVPGNKENTTEDSDSSSDSSSGSSSGSSSDSDSSSSSSSGSSSSDSESSSDSDSDSDSDSSSDSGSDSSDEDKEDLSMPPPATPGAPSSAVPVTPKPVNESVSCTSDSHNDDPDSDGSSSEDDPNEVEREKSSRRVSFAGVPEQVGHKALQSLLFKPPLLKSPSHFLASSTKIMGRVPPNTLPSKRQNPEELDTTAVVCQKPGADCVNEKPVNKRAKVEKHHSDGENDVSTELAPSDVDNSTVKKRPEATPSSVKNSSAKKRPEATPSNVKNSTVKKRLEATPSNVEDSPAKKRPETTPSNVDESAVKERQEAAPSNVKKRPAVTQRVTRSRKLKQT